MTAGDAPEPDVAALVLAAGLGTRFGAPSGGRKVLAPLAGRPLVGHAITAARTAGLPVHVVVPSDPAVAAAVSSAGAVPVVATAGAVGQRSSLQQGLRALPPGTAAVVVLLGDQPGIDPSVIRDLVRSWHGAPGSAWRVRYADGPGHPVLLPASAWPSVLEAAPADVGARDLLADLDLRELVVAGPAPRDVDRPEDLPGSA